MGKGQGVDTDALLGSYNNQIAHPISGKIVLVTAPVVVKVEFPSSKQELNVVGGVTVPPKIPEGQGIDLGTFVLRFISWTSKFEGLGNKKYKKRV